MRNWGLVLLLAGVSMLGAFSIDTYLPSFPDIARSLNIERVIVQHTLTVYLFSFAVMTLFYGTLSDTFGRRPVVLVPLAGYVMASLGAAFARDIGWLLFFRGLQGFSSGAGSVVGRAIVRDRFQGQEGQRVLSYVTMVFGLAPALAPIIGGWLQRWWGWRSVFFFLAAMSCALLLACWRMLPETLPREKRHPLHLASILRHYGQVASHVPFLLQALAIGFGFSGLALYISTAPDFIVKVLHLSETSFGWLFIPVIIGMASGSAVSGRLAHLVRPARLIWISFMIQCAAAVANLLYTQWSIPSIPWAVIPLACYVFGMALGAPAMMLRALDMFPGVRGLAASLQAFLGMLVFSGISGLVAPYVLGNAQRLAFGMAAGCGLTLLCWFLGTRSKEAIHIPAERSEVLDQEERVA